VHRHGGTAPGALTPICNECAISLCWDVGLDEYEEDREFWDRWTCQECREADGLERMSLKEWKRERQPEPSGQAASPVRPQRIRGLRPAGQGARHVTEARKTG